MSSAHTNIASKQNERLHKPSESRALIYNAQRHIYLLIKFSIVWSSVYSWNLFACFPMLFKCSYLRIHGGAFASIAFDSVRFIILSYRSTRTQCRSIKFTCMHLHRVSISILIVANGNIRVDLNGTAWYGMVCAVVVIGETKWIH